MTIGLGHGYKSGAQIARRVTEAWACDHFFCVSCSSDTVCQSPCNTKATDFTCPRCSARYQLKAGKKWNEHRIPDAGYSAMVEAIRTDQTPNLLVMQYTPKWTVHQLMLVPSFFFSEAAVQKRKPLSPNARRAGWIGCNILLSAIAPEGKIRIVENGMPADPAVVRAKYDRVRPLENVDVPMRGWTLDVLRVVRSLGRKIFELADLYMHEHLLKALHPKNQNIRPKIRQQLQVLRSLGLLQFRGTGKYELTEGA